MKTKILISVVLLFAVFVFEGCKKKNKLETVVEGRVMTLGTNDPASTEPLEINLYSRAGGKGLGTGETLLKKGKTDKNGYFKFEFTAANDYTGHYLRVLTEPIENHHAGSGKQYPIEVGTNQRKDIFIPAHAWLNLHVRNLNPYPGDKITVRWNASVYFAFEGYTDDTITLFGSGSINRAYVSTLFRNNQILPAYDTAWMQAFDTTYHLLEY